MLRPSRIVPLRWNRRRRCAEQTVVTKFDTRRLARFRTAPRTPASLAVFRWVAAAARGIGRFDCCRPASSTASMASRNLTRRLLLPARGCLRSRFTGQVNAPRQDCESKCTGRRLDGSVRLGPNGLLHAHA